MRTVAAGDGGVKTLSRSGPEVLGAATMSGVGFLAMSLAAAHRAAHPVPTNAGYSVLLLVHVGAAIVGFGAMVVTGAQARRARRGPDDDAADGVRRYFRPGVNWVARALYLVPVFGFALLADSSGAFAAGDGFVVWGLFLWLVAVLVAEMVVWPGERRIQQIVSGQQGHHWGDLATAQEFDRQCRRVATASVVLSFVFVLAFVIMIAKP